MGRPKLTKLDILRAKVWAHTCAWEAGADKEKKVSSYRLTKLANDFRREKNDAFELDTGFWSRCLRGKKGVSPKLVANLGDKELWPLAYAAYHVGPPIPCGDDGEGYYDCAPLWAILANRPEAVLKGWSAMRNEVWVAWMPFMYEENPSGQPFDTWLGPWPGVFKNRATLNDFLRQFLDQLDDLEPLLALTVILSRTVLREDKWVFLRVQLTAKLQARIDEYLALFDIRLQDLADAALENGLEIDLESC